MTPFLAIVGPTGSGKTALSLALARELDGEIVSMDSRQVYRGLDIGTDKVDADTRSRVPHHGIDLVSPHERYSAGRFARDARSWIRAISARGRVPILVGGTGFFLRSVTEPLFREPELDPERRERLRAWLSRIPTERLQAWVGRLDPEAAARGETGGPHRLARVLEVALLSGRTLSTWHRESPEDGEPLRGAIALVELPREEMDRRIEERVATMLERGLVAEVRGLLASGVEPGAPGMTATGYREIARHLAGACTLAEAEAEIRGNTRKYARRQLTWYRHQLPPHAIRIDGLLPLEQRVAQAREAWESMVQPSGDRR